MEAAVHLPQVDLTGEGISGARVDDVARAAVDRGFAAVSANDHLVFGRPWLDGLGLLSRVSPLVGDLDLVTSVVLAPVRGPAVVAAAVATLAALARGRVVVGIGPGSSAADYAAVGVPFEERWARLEESVHIVRALLEGADPATVKARHYPMPEQWSAPLLSRPPSVWLGSWGSAAGLRRVAALADGWLASAYNTDPERFGRALVDLAAERQRLGRGGPLPNALATMWTYVTEDAAEADRVVREVLAPVLRRDAAEIRGRVCVGPAGACADLLARFAAQGCRRVHFWPAADEVRQIELLSSRVLPQLA